ncbi:SURF1 family protein [Paracoccus pacificus]|uniref:SURF1-like protein n=1 Tax=Paracoccus pacificus TaxID=1463598 RepID=A0ABW4R933_9RHOB
MRRIWAPLIFGIVGCAILIGLGVWQIKRLAWKESMLAEMQSRIDAAPVPLPAQVDPSMKYDPVWVNGTTSGPEIMVVSGSRETGGGYQVITAFDTDDGPRILLDRGFLPEDHRREKRPPVALTVVGNLHWPAEKSSTTPDPNLDENIWFARDVPAMARALGTEPIMVVAAEIRGDTQGITPVPLGVEGIPNNHLEYAVTWFMLAAVWAGMTVGLIWRIRRKQY